MKILITGGCGFIGSNLSIFLKIKSLIYILWIIFIENPNKHIKLLD